MQECAAFSKFSAHHASGHHDDSRRPAARPGALARLCRWRSAPRGEAGRLSQVEMPETMASLRLSAGRQPG